jgi:hypothetical protein
MHGLQLDGGLMLLLYALPRLVAALIAAIFVAASLRASRKSSSSLGIANLQTGRNCSTRNC